MENNRNHQGYDTTYHQTQLNADVGYKTQATFFSGGMVTLSENRSLI